MKSIAVAIVGGGRLGTALARQLANAGYEIDEIICRDHRSALVKARKLARELGARACAAPAASLGARLVWLCVPDAQIPKAASELANKSWQGKIAFHSSGVLTSDALAVLREKGAAVAAVHPLMTFVRGTTPELRSVTFALEGGKRATSEARRIVHDLGGEVLHLRKSDKAGYHAFRNHGLSLAGFTIGNGGEGRGAEWTVECGSAPSPYADSPANRGELCSARPGRSVHRPGPAGRRGNHAVASSRACHNSPCKRGLLGTCRSGTPESAGA